MELEALIAFSDHEFAQDPKPMGVHELIMFALATFF